MRLKGVWTVGIGRQRGLFRREQRLQCLQRVGVAGELVPAEAGDAGEAHGEAGAVAGGALQALEGDFEDEAVVGLGAHGADRAEAVGGVVRTKRSIRASSSSVKPK